MAVVTQKCRPGLPARWVPSHAAHVPLDRSLREANAQLQELAADALRSPESIVRGHCANQNDRIAGNLWFCDLVPRLPQRVLGDELLAGAWQVAEQTDDRRPRPGSDPHEGVQSLERVTHHGANALETPREHDRLAPARFLNDPTADGVK